MTRNRSRGTVASALLVAAIALATSCAGRVQPTMAPSRAAGEPGPAGTFHLDLALEPTVVKAGEPVHLSFQALDPQGSSIRFLELVHERPLHLLIVSEDLDEFDHVHPEQIVGTTYDLTHVFAHGGRYRLYAGFTPPGSGSLVDRFTVNVAGPPRPRVRLVPDETRTKVVDGIRLTLIFDQPLRAGADLQLRCALEDATTGLPVTDLQLYLGALAHIVAIPEDLDGFLHIHPMEAGEIYDPSKDPAAHFHDPRQLAKQLVGPSPSEVTAVASFPRAGTYKMWIQLQRKDRTITVPFVLKVGTPEALRAHHPQAIPKDAIQVTVSASGYTPARIDVERGRPVRLAFVRPDAANCGGKVVFPSLDRTYDLPVGEVVLVEFTPEKAGEIAFTCGMGMLKGLVVAK